MWSRVASRSGWSAPAPAAVPSSLSCAARPDGDGEEEFVHRRLRLRRRVRGCQQRRRRAEMRRVRSSPLTLIVDLSIAHAATHRSASAGVAANASREGAQSSAVAAEIVCALFHQTSRGCAPTCTCAGTDAVSAPGARYARSAGGRAPGPPRDTPPATTATEPEKRVLAHQPPRLPSPSGPILGCVSAVASACQVRSALLHP